MKHAGLLALALLLAACSDSGDSNNPAAPGTPLPGNGNGDIALKDWRPLPPAAQLQPSAETLAARERILGADATDPKEVKLWWYGVSSFIASMGGHLFLLDVWEIVGLHEDYVPIGRDELSALKPEAILIGHGHFDHAADSGYIAGRSGAVLVASEEVCTSAKEDAARDRNADNFRCLILGSAEEPEVGTVRPVKLWRDLPAIHVLRHLHSAPTIRDRGDAFFHTPAFKPFFQHFNTSPSEWWRFIRHLTDVQGGAWAYQLRIGEFSLLWYDSSGPINTGEQAIAIQKSLRGLPDCVDVQLAPIVGFNQMLSGLRDPRLYVEHAHPRVVLPTHHDAWIPLMGGGAAAYEKEWRKELDSLPNPPELDYLRDPDDYLKVRSYRVDEPRWKAPMPGSACAREVAES